jgi:hypothetical protein
MQEQSTVSAAIIDQLTSKIRRHMLAIQPITPPEAQTAVVEDGEVKLEPVFTGANIYQAYVYHDRKWRLCECAYCMKTLVTRDDNGRYHCADFDCAHNGPCYRMRMRRNGDETLL